ncbi:MAG TPA: hypothetical protein PLP27_05530 [Crocinitomicaceae bacterium]|nr:hypothetical protein [Crocinitomicaceae bacterium]
MIFQLTKDKIQALQVQYTELYKGQNKKYQPPKKHQNTHHDTYTAI